LLFHACSLSEKTGSGKIAHCRPLFARVSSGPVTPLAQIFCAKPMAETNCINPRSPDMTETATNAESYRVTADELRQFVERVERLDAEKKDLAEQQKEVMAEAKSRGYDTKVLRKIISLRKRDQNDIAEEEAILEMYKEALGM
jgi:uncharacterized protein (UPF0335 family)